MKTKHKELKPTVCGVGINDAGKEGKEFRPTWYGMLYRCYSESWHKRFPTYKNCSVVGEWKKLSNFKSWMEGQEWVGMHLDKDILFEGNKIYSPDTCVFVTGVTNTFLNERVAKRGTNPLGVYWDKGKERFCSMVNNPFTNKQENLGRFKCPNKAHLEWGKRKYELALQLANEQSDERVADALRVRYQKYA